MAALELLARAAPARVVSADVLVLRLDSRLGRDRAAAGDGRGRDAARGGDRVRAGQRLVLVAEVAVPAVARARRRGSAPAGAARALPAVVRSPRPARGRGARRPPRGSRGSAPGT